MGQYFLLVLFFLFHPWQGSGLTVEEFIPFGESNGDTVFFSNDDNTTSITVPLKFPFFGRLYSTIHVRDCQPSIMSPFVFGIIDIVAINIY